MALLSNQVKPRPADDGIRGLPVAFITTSSRWLTGPDFLSRDEQEWPEDIANRTVDDIPPAAVLEVDTHFVGKVAAKENSVELVDIPHCFALCPLWCTFNDFYIIVRYLQERGYMARRQLKSWREQRNS